MKEFTRRSIAKDSEAAKRLSSFEVAIRQMQVGNERAIPDLHIDTLLERQRLQGTA